MVRIAMLTNPASSQDYKGEVVSYRAKVIRLNDNVEEEVLLQIGEWKIPCFAGICPYRICEGMEYLVDLSLLVLDEYEVKELPSGSSPAILSDGEGFGAELIGKINGNRLCVGELEFEDDILLSDYGYLDGKSVSVRADRIDVEFLR